MQIKKEDDNFDFKKGNIKEVYYVEELEHQTYPFKPDIIKFDDSIYNLSEKLDCKVTYEEENYLISNETLNISVWGDTRDEAEQAFCFVFSSLYQNFAKESDDKLTDESKEIKTKLLCLVKAVHKDEN